MVFIPEISVVVAYFGFNCGNRDHIADIFPAEEHHAQAVKADATFQHAEQTILHGFLAGSVFISSSTHPFSTLLDSLP